jgi:hypothetical protein
VPTTEKLFKVRKFTGELPSVNGKERIPSPFDDVVKASFDQGGEVMLVEAPADEDLRAKIVLALHKAAKFHGVGLDLWRTIPEGVAFKARAKRDVKRSSNGAAAA